VAKIIKNILILFILVMQGCATVEYSSESPALRVAECIVDGWKKAPNWNGHFPALLEERENYYFVHIADLSPGGVLIPTSVKHPLSFSRWAEVRDVNPGSKTLYYYSFYGYMIRKDFFSSIVINCQYPEDIK
jgi:hypothetical protein